MSWQWEQIKITSRDISFAYFVNFVHWSLSYSTLRSSVSQPLPTEEPLN